jgi:hypothetical protein
VDEQSWLQWQLDDLNADDALERGWDSRHWVRTAFDQEDDPGREEASFYREDSYFGSQYEGASITNALPHLIRQHIPGRLFNISNMWSSADTSSLKPRTSLAILNSRKRMGVRQSRISAEFQLSILTMGRRE